MIYQNGAIFSYLEWPLAKILSVPLFDVYYLRNDTIYGHSYRGTPA